MAVVEIKVLLNTDNDQDAVQIANLLGVLGGKNALNVKPTETVEEIAKTIKKKTSKVEETKVEETKVETTIKVEDIRAKVSEKTNISNAKADDNRSALKNKLAELGCKNVTTLDPANYEAFIAFLNTLE